MMYRRTQPSFNGQERAFKEVTCLLRSEIRLVMRHEEDTTYKTLLSCLSLETTERKTKESDRWRSKYQLYYGYHLG